MKELKPFVIIAIVYALFNLPQLDTLIDEKLKPSSQYIKIGVKTLIYVIALYLILNMTK